MKKSVNFRLPEAEFGSSPATSDDGDTQRTKTEILRGDSSRSLEPPARRSESEETETLSRVCLDTIDGARLGDRSLLTPGML